MKSYDEWLAECSEHEEKNIKKDKQGGIVPKYKNRAKKAVLITFPVGLEGGNCGNCKFYHAEGDHGDCTHPEMQMHVNPRMCCNHWDNKKALRTWQ